MLTASYQSQTINTIDELATILLIDTSELKRLARNSDRYYRPNEPTIGANGTTRQTYSVTSSLQKIQYSILREILQMVHFPEYICAVKNDEFDRDFVADARRHVGSKVMLKEDIKNFFPSIRFSTIRLLWHGVCEFPDEVATVLTQLTTYQGFLPQGACTSPYIASLIFWDKEPQLEESLRQAGYTYSRYLDDSTISSARRVRMKDLSWVKAQLYGMWASIGAKPNRRKANIATSGNRQSVHGLTTNSGRPSVSKDYRSNVRAAIYSLGSRDVTLRQTTEYLEDYHQLEGKIAHIQRCNPSYAEKLHKQLQAIAPKSPIKLFT